MSRAEEIFQPALVGKKIPILTLDNKWHKLFTQKEYTSEIKRTENELNKLLKRQSKLNEECKEIKKLKKKMMDEIVILADALEKSPSKKLEKEMEEHRCNVNECNEKIDAYEEELIELPRQINQVNNRLMVATMEVCYRKLQKSTAELDEINDWISSIRRELKKKVVRKQEKEAMINQLYAYMHDIFGADVIELFDMKYNPEEKNKKNQDSAKQDGESETEKQEEDENALKS
ncbi:MAG: hypothetical protein K2J99_08900 [Lachnospiraceae bacterium]|nr:hypothetical protein [Lachnospiraceae bacterium]